MNYYVVSPNIFNNGDNYACKMYNKGIAAVGWDVDGDKGRQFKSIQIGDCIIVAKRFNWVWEYYYLGIVVGEENKPSLGTLSKKLSPIIRLNSHCGLDFNNWSANGSIQIPSPQRIIKDNEENLKIIKQIDNILIMNEYQKLLEFNHNLILTGAPGTGKTYLAKQIAAQIILGKEFDEKTATDAEKKKMEEQCGFVQFHPSYDYTDFVEGLRPIKEGNTLGFQRKDGVFKEFCKKAIVSNDVVIGQETKQITIDLVKNLFQELWDNIRKGKVETITLSSGKDSLRMIVDDNNKETIHFSSKDNRNVVSDGNDVTINDIIAIIFDNNINTIESLTKAGPNRETLGVGGNTSNKWAVCKYILDRCHVNFTYEHCLPYVFIIDEINRGEISKIFGELFYSIDPGYRGEKGKVDTQYQNLIPKEDDYDFESDKADVFRNGFYVPENVYIIGTMNDIDRSVESMDFAMRRRFAFKEVFAKDRMGMLQEDEKLGAYFEDIKKRMINLNLAILTVQGLSEAYQIGAAYFLKLKNYLTSDDKIDDSSWDNLWNYHLQGLLFEYLRGTPNAKEDLETLKRAFESEAPDHENEDHTITKTTPNA